MASTNRTQNFSSSTVQMSTTESIFPYGNYSSDSDINGSNNNESAIFSIDAGDGGDGGRTMTTTSNYYYYSDYNNDNISSAIDDELGITTTSGTIMDTITVNPGYNPSIVESSEVVERQQFWIGVGLSVSSSVFIGLSFIIKKKALIRLSKGGKRANQGGYGYLKDLLWWSGLLSMGIGEAANFMAYTFAPASLVSTLGVLSVLVTAVFSSRYLNERLNFLGKIGCFLCAIGSTVIVLHAPMEKEIVSMDDLESKLTNFMFVFYVLFTIVISLILIYHYRPKLPETSTYTLLIWIGVCSMIGSLSVMSVKGLGLALMQTVTGIENELNSWLTWFCLVTLIVCVSVQMNFLNKALDTFNTAVVTPIYYVFFTSCVIIASAILFNEFANLPVQHWIGLACGFFTVLIAIILLHLCKNFDLTLVNLAQQIDLVNDSHSGSVTGGGGGGSTSHYHLHHPHLSSSSSGKGDSLPLPFPTSASSCAIPPSTTTVVTIADNVREMDLESQQQQKQGVSDTDSDLDDLYKSVDSCNSTRCGNTSNKSSSSSKKKNAASSSPLSLTPDARLLSGSYSSSTGGRNRDGYVPLSYGTTDNHVTNF